MKGRKTPKGGKTPPKYRFLEHTADIMLEADGGTYPEALKHAAEGMFSVLGSAKPKEKFSIDEQAPNREELVVYALSKMLTECEGRGIVPCEAKVLEYDEGAVRIAMQVWGEKKMPRDAIKAVTFHELMVKQDEKTRMWKIRVLFDV